MDDARESREEKHFLFGRGLIAAPVDSMYTPNTISGTDRHLFLSQIFFFISSCCGRFCGQHPTEPQNVFG